MQERRMSRLPSLVSQEFCLFAQLTGVTGQRAVGVTLAAICVVRMIVCPCEASVLCVQRSEPTCRQR